MCDAIDVSDHNSIKVVQAVLGQEVLYCAAFSMRMHCTKGAAATVAATSTCDSASSIHSHLEQLAADLDLEECDQRWRPAQAQVAVLGLGCWAVASPLPNSSSTMGSDRTASPSSWHPCHATCICISLSSSCRTDQGHPPHPEGTRPTQKSCFQERAAGFLPTPDPMLAC